ncbi:MAG: toprim domain-containing protein, partial [Gammaproteobacteria bacterium]|nr:toprim domain-containing protein [Gammaproteobacteria bacterium]
MTENRKIPQEEINAIKTDTDIITLIQSRGIPLKKNGKGYVGKCPFHDDTTPSLSVTPGENLFQCFGCGAGGDVIRFVELFDNVTFPEAVTRLGADKQDFSFNRKTCTEPESSLTDARANELLERTVTLYENTFTQTTEATHYLTGRGITDTGLFGHYRAGYCDGTLNMILPDDPQLKEELQMLGILNDTHYERFKGCVVFPILDPEGRIVTLYGRHIIERRHVYLPNRPKGVWNSGIMKTSARVILVESVIDALSVMASGYPNVISIQSATGLADSDIMAFKECGVQSFILLMDGDDAGKKAEKRLKEKCAEFACETKQLPDGHDPNSFLMAFGAEALAQLINKEEGEESEEESGIESEKEIREASEKEIHKESAKVPESNDISKPKSTPSKAEIITTSTGFIVHYGPRKYRIIGLDKSARKLKVTVRVEQGGKLHVDNALDFYSARSRRSFAQDLCRVFEAVPQAIESDINRLMLACESAPEPDKLTPEPITLSTKDKRDAEAFGKSTDLTDRILQHLTQCGLIGEAANKLLGYIVMTSRKLAKPLAMFILSSSGAGKTALQDAVTAFCPPEDLVKLTNLSGKALFYKDRESLKHKVLSIEEGDGAGEAMYAIRNLISAGVLISETTVKDLSTGKLTTMESRVEGPTAVFLTTTNPDTDPETMSRFFVTGIDESRDQTRRILAYQRETHMATDSDPEKERLQKIHHNFQRLLKPITVKNPYRDQLAYGDDRLQGRRDQP